MSDRFFQWERGATRTARRAASVFSLMFAVLLIVWLFRGILELRPYATGILLTAFAALFVNRLLRIRTYLGLLRALSSLLWNLAVYAFYALITIWILGWAASVQGESLPLLFSNLTPILVLLAIALGLAAFAVRQVSPRGFKTSVEKAPRLIAKEAKLRLGKVSITPRGEVVTIPLRRFGRKFGHVLFGEVDSNIDTPMGPLALRIKEPSVLYGAQLQDQKVTEDEVRRIAGKEVSKLLDEAKKIALQPTSEGGTKAEVVDLPFVHVRRDEMGEVVDVGPVHVNRGPYGEEVHVGPIRVSSGRSRATPLFWGIIGHGNHSVIRSSGGRVSAEWNGTKVRLEHDSMQMKVGEDTFNYSPSSIETRSPIHLLRIDQQNASIYTKQFTIKISGEGAVLRTDGKTKTVDKPEFADELKSTLAEQAQKHIQDMMDGLPIDLDDTLIEVERVLGKYVE